jgi:hypothetical protein
MTSRLLPFVVALLASGCGPTLYTVNVFEAAGVVEQAREAEAADAAPYPYYGAEAYLAKAREEASEGQYQDAIHYARRAAELAREALREARRGER